MSCHVYSLLYPHYSISVPYTCTEETKNRHKGKNMIINVITSGCDPLHFILLPLWHDADIHLVLESRGGRLVIFFSLPYL